MMQVPSCLSRNLDKIRNQQAGPELLPLAASCLSAVCQAPAQHQQKGLLGRPQRPHLHSMGFHKTVIFPGASILLVVLMDMDPKYSDKTCTE
jgi:hypothetical protein